MLTRLIDRENNRSPKNAGGPAHHLPYPQFFLNYRSHTHKQLYMFVRSRRRGVRYIYYGAVYTLYARGKEKLY